MSDRKIPVFDNEYDEAEWWYAHRAETAADLVRASRAGKLGPGSRARRAQKLRQLNSTGYLDIQQRTKLYGLKIVTFIEGSSQPSSNTQHEVFIQHEVVAFGRPIEEIFTGRAESSRRCA